MSEQRFSVNIRKEENEVIYSFFDRDKPLDLDMIVGLLNEQQATIQSLDKQLTNIILDYKKLNKDNREQQATINELKERIKELEDEL